MRSARWLLSLLLLSSAAGAVLAPAPAYADDEDDGDDEFDANWIGVRLGIWYRPEIRMDADIGGQAGGALATILGGTDFDVERTLGVTQTMTNESDYGVPDLDGNATWELEAYWEGDWVSIRVGAVLPYQYEGKKTLQREIEFGGVTFPVSTDVESEFEQFHFNIDFSINIFNNRYFMIAPMAGVQFLGLNWEVKDLTTGITADTSDIDSPFSLGDFEFFPTPMLGADLRVGYRDYFEVGARISGIYVNYLGMEGSALRAEAFVAVYPIPYLGIQAGYRFLAWNVGSTSNDPTETYDIDLDFQGFTFSLTVRI